MQMVSKQSPCYLPFVSTGQGELERDELKANGGVHVQRAEEAGIW